MNNRAKGSYYRNKTKKWYEDKGWTVALAENKIAVWVKGKMFYAPKDLFGADLIAMNGKELIFIQCKTNKSGMSRAREEFSKYPFPPYIRRHIIRWEKRARNPELVIL